MKYGKTILTCLIVYICMLSSACSPDENNKKDTLKLEKFGISEKSINEFFSTGLYKGLLDEGDPVLVLAMMSKTIPKPDINMGFFLQVNKWEKNRTWREYYESAFCFRIYRNV